MSQLNATPTNEAGSGTTAAGEHAAPSPAQSAAPLDLEKLKAEISKQARDSVYAELRRNGALKKSAIAAIDGISPATTTTVPTPNGATPQVDLRSLDRAVGRLGAAPNLSDRAYRVMEAEFQRERPTDAAEWVKGYLQDMGLSAGTNPATTAQPPATAPRNERPASDRGSPAAPRVNLEELDLTANPSEEDVNALVAKIGPSRYRDMLMRQLRGKRFTYR